MNVTDGIAQRSMAEYTGILINGVWQAGEGSFPVLDKYTLAPAAEVSRASRRQVAQAVAQCKAAADRGERRRRANARPSCAARPACWTPIVRTSRPS
nr:hypothetical protein [Bordetella bronchiseptica]